MRLLLHETRINILGSKQNNQHERTKMRTPRNAHVTDGTNTHRINEFVDSAAVIVDQELDKLQRSRS